VRVWNDSTNTTGNSFVVNNCSLVIVVFSVHGCLVRGLLGRLKLDIMGNVIWLSSEEFLFEVFSVNHRWEVSLHLCLAIDQFMKVFV